MPMTVRYTVVDGEVIAEKRNGVRNLYVPDPLGSTVALLDNTQTPTDTFTYWPYGEVNTRTGTTATPFQFVGTRGYYRDSASRDYACARELDKAKGRWLTQDPTGFRRGDFNLYQYAGNNLVTLSDPSGKQPRRRPPGFGPGIPVDPSTGLGRCFTMSPGACFWCAYSYLLNTRQSDGHFPTPSTACYVANLRCGAHINCDNPPSPPACPNPGGGRPNPGGGWLVPWPPPFPSPGDVGPGCCQFACQMIGGGMNIQCEGLCRNWLRVSRATAIPCEWLERTCGGLSQPNRELCVSVYLECC